MGVLLPALVTVGAIYIGVKLLKKFGRWMLGVLAVLALMVGITGYLIGDGDVIGFTEIMVGKFSESLELDREGERIHVYQEGYEWTYNWEENKYEGRMEADGSSGRGLVNHSMFMSYVYGDNVGLLVPRKVREWVREAQESEKIKSSMRWDSLIFEDRGEMIRVYNE